MLNLSGYRNVDSEAKLLSVSMDGGAHIDKVSKKLLRAIFVMRNITGFVSCEVHISPFCTLTSMQSLFGVTQPRFMDYAPCR